MPGFVIELIDIKIKVVIEAFLFHVITSIAVEFELILVLVDGLDGLHDLGALEIGLSRIGKEANPLGGLGEESSLHTFS